MLNDERRFLRTALVRRTAGVGADVGDEAERDRFSTRNGIGQTHEKVGQRKKRQQSPADARGLPSWQSLTGLCAHFTGLANPDTEHYYNVGSVHGEFATVAP